MIKYLILLGCLLSLLAPSFVLAYEAAPYSVTLPPTFVTERSVQLNGRVNPSEMLDTYQWFEWGIVGRADVYETNHNQTWGGNVLANTSAALVGLAPATQYFYRQISENGRGRDVGQTGYVTTKPLVSALRPIVIVTTNDAVSVGDSVATLRGYISPHGNSATKVWFEWGMTTRMENGTPEQGAWGDSVTVSAPVNSLMPGTLYYFRVVAENEQGRSYGLLKVFSTTGTPVTVLVETPRVQYVPSPVTPSLNSVSRKVTTSGEVTPIQPVAQPAVAPQARQGNTTAPPDVFSKGIFLPPDFFTKLLENKKKESAPTGGVAVQAEGEDETQQIAGVAASVGAFDDVWGMLTGKKDVEVAVLKIGPSDLSVHMPVEYRVAYSYLRDIPVAAKLSITLPGDVIYIGDNTNNELLLETGSGRERTYVLPLGRIEQGSMRAISILGMTTGNAKGFPDVGVRMEYTDGGGTHIVLPVNGTLSNKKRNTASVANAKNGIIPDSLAGWIAYILLVIGIVVGIRKAKEYYVKRKESLAASVAKANEENGYIPMSQYLPVTEEITPQGA